MAHLTVEVVYRGIFQKNLARGSSRASCSRRRKEGRSGISFGRYGDSPERNGIPAKSFAIVADTEEELESTWPATSPRRSTSRSCVDDTLCKGVESWAWYGLQPINRLTAARRHAHRDLHASAEDAALRWTTTRRTRRTTWRS